MSTITPTTRQVRDPWQQIPASWGTYQRLVRDRGEHGRPKYTFCDGKLTIVSPGLNHELMKELVGGLIGDILVGLRIPYRGAGETRYIKEADRRSGTEPDLSYYLTNLALLRGKKRLILGTDPPPDLVVEVVSTHPLGDSLEVYRRFAVPEVWVCKSSVIDFLVLGEDGHYLKSSTSAGLPFLSTEELSPWVYRQDLPDDSELRHQFRAWVADILSKKRGQGPFSPQEDD